jgi:hypothetical protein
MTLRQFLIGNKPTSFRVVDEITQDQSSSNQRKLRCPALHAPLPYSCDNHDAERNRMASLVCVKEPVIGVAAALHHHLWKDRAIVRKVVKVIIIEPLHGVDLSLVLNL